MVEERRWLDDRQYAEILSVCQVLPGPNVGNVSVFIGDRFHGAVGSLLAIVGLMTGPLATLLALAFLYDWLGQVPAIDGAIGGVAAGAAGLFIGTALKVAEKLRLPPSGLIILISSFLAIGVLRWPLLVVVPILATMSITLSWRSRW
jgi:chromate transporter